MSWADTTRKDGRTSAHRIAGERLWKSRSVETPKQGSHCAWIPTFPQPRRRRLIDLKPGISCAPKTGHFNLLTTLAIEGKIQRLKNEGWNPARALLQSGFFASLKAHAFRPWPRRMLQLDRHRSAVAAFYNVKPLFILNRGVILATMPDASRGNPFGRRTRGRAERRTAIIRSKVVERTGAGSRPSHRRDVGQPPVANAPDFQ
jgi:hypothetical protein